MKQYFSCGVPALGSDIGGNKKFLENGKNGFICKTAAAYGEMIVKVKDMEKKIMRALAAMLEIRLRNFL